jgi:hypothetical protein
MPEETTDPQMKAFIQNLKSASPLAGNLNRDELLFTAGRAAQARSARVWQYSTALLALVAVGLGTTLALRAPDVVERERLVYLEQPAAARSAPQTSTPRPISAETPSAHVETDGNEGVELPARLLLAGGNAASVTSAEWAHTALRPLSQSVPEAAALRFSRNSGDSGDSIR